MSWNVVGGKNVFGSCLIAKSLLVPALLALWCGMCYTPLMRGQQVGHPKSHARGSADSMAATVAQR